MTPYKSFAVAGAGKIGTLITKALLANGADVIVLTRGGSTKDLPSAVQLEVVDYTSGASITAALKKHNVEVFISTLGIDALGGPNLIGDAAKEAGVRLFVPSEYGMPSVGSTDGLLGVKNAFAGLSTQRLKVIGLPSARFFVGFFTGEVLWLTGYDVNGKINIVGDGAVPVSFTAESDIAGFISYVLTALEPAQLEDKLFRLQGDRKTFLEVAKLFNTEAVHVDVMPGPASPITTMLQKFIHTGLGSTGWDFAAGKEGSDSAGSSNILWPGHHWKTIKEVHGQKIKDSLYIYLMSC